VAVERSSAQSAKPFVIACIPALNEEDSIAKVVLQTKPYTDRIIVCDDGSTDVTAAIAEGLGATVIKHPMNFGYGASLASLFKYCRDAGADIMITLDADGQHDPRFIPALVKPLLDDEADIVIGSRFLGSGKVPEVRKAGITMINQIAKAASYSELTDSQSGFRAYNRKAIEAITIEETGMGASTEILVKAKTNSLRLAEVPVTISYGRGSVSQNPIRHGASVVLSTIRQMSIEQPLKLYGVPAVIFLAISFFFGAWAISSYIENHSMPITLALVAVGSGLLGAFLLISMMVLWVMSSLVKERRAER
jgi:glycosyltransferase involved in cell wall biosynthesis